MDIDFRRAEWPLASPFRIAYEVSAVASVVQVQLRDGPHYGRGEAVGVSYHGENVDSMMVQLESVRTALSQGATRGDLAQMLPPGGARNAVDCALWDLEAKRTGKRAWELAGVSLTGATTTDYTLGIDTPAAMATKAAAMTEHSSLKLKLDGNGDLERVLAVRAARPDALLIVDANQSWTEMQLRDLAPAMAKIGVKLIEQPLPVGGDDALREYECPVPLCADESCQTSQSLRELFGKYQYVNIKLDKTGGLTEALRLADEARRQGFRLMVGCMAGTSLSMAPAFVLGQLCEFVDLDGPLLLARDFSPALRYERGLMHPPDRALWG